MVNNRNKLGKTKVLLTGVCGMIGSHLLDSLLDSGHEVIGVDNLSHGALANISKHRKHPNFKFYKVDICDAKKLIKKVGPVDQVLHMAAVKKIGEGDPVWGTLHVNAVGTESIMAYAREFKAHIILGSTSDVYGMSDQIPFNEETPSSIGSSTAKRWSYAIAKLYAEHIVLGMGKDYQIPVTVLRFFGSFSERSSGTWSGGHIPIFVDAIKNNKTITIHGDGSQTRSMGHVDDVVRGTILAMHSKKAIGHIINLGNDEEVSVLESAKLIHRLMGVAKPLKIQFVPMKKIFGSYQEIPRRVPDLRKAKKLIGYKPLIPFETALQRMIDARR